MTRARTAGALTASVVLASGCGLIQHSASLTFQVGNVECSPGKSLGQVCSFLAFYGNISKHPIQVEPATTMVLDKTGKTFLPTADHAAGTFLLKPGQQQQVSWSVALPQNTRPTKVQWHGSAVDVQFQVPGAVGPSGSTVPSSAVPPSAAPTVAATSATPSTAVAPTTPVPTSAAVVTTTTTAPKTTKPVVKPSKTTVKPTKTPPATTTTPVTTTTPAPPTTPSATRTRHTTPPVTHHTPTPTTANSSNPGGGIGHIG